MIKVCDNDRRKIAFLFEGIWDSMVIAYLQCYQGTAWVDKMPEPDFGFIISGEYSFFGGDAASDEAADAIRHLSQYIDGDETTAIYSPEHLEWRDLLLKCHPENASEVMRYWIVQKDYDFDKKKLQSFVDRLPDEYELRRFDTELYNQAMSEAWSLEFCETFESAEDYLSKGFGFAVTYQGHLASATSTMTVYDGGTEIQVATKEEFRGKGLALSTAARFIIECQERGIRPCWDAANKISLHMAMKLGYEYNGEYSTVHISL